MTATLVRGGTVVDVAARGLVKADVLIRDGAVEAIAPQLDAAELDVDTGTFDASGCYVAPGFIDIHTHVFAHGLFATSRVMADRVGVDQGVACLVDAGSSGAATADAFPRFVHDTQATPVFALLNIGSPGLPAVGGGHSSRPELVSLDRTVGAVERNRSWVRGIKVQASASHTGAFGLDAVRLARKAAELTGLPLMVHIGNAPPVLDDVLDMLRPGDIVTHAFHGKVGGVLAYGGKVLPALRAALDRGVMLDVGHGRSSFSFATCERALEQGVPVHSISTDIHRGSIDRYVLSLARTMTKLLLLGVDLVDVVRAVTTTPAGALGLDGDGFGALAPGRAAHVTIFRLRDDDPLDVEDSGGETRHARQWIETVGVFVGGQHHPVVAPL